MDVNNLSDLDKKIVAVSAAIGVEKLNNLENFVERSELFYENKLYSQALSDAKAAIDHGFKTVRAYIAAGRACDKLGNFNECYDYYKEGLALDPKHPELIQDLKLLQSHILEEYENTDRPAESSYNAVFMSSQEYYPGDDQLYLLENEILVKKYKFKTKPETKIKQPDMKTRKEAASIGVMAYNCKETKQYNDALHFCSNAIAKDATNFRLLQMRAEILIALEEELKAMQDLFTIPKTYRSPETWKLGGKILYKLELPVTAEFWLRKATQLPNNEKDVESATLFQKVRVKRIYGPYTDKYDVVVDFSDYGRAVIATSPFKVGENAFEDIPVVLGQLLSNIKSPACWHCGNSLITQKEFFGDDYNSFPNDLQSFVDEHWPDVSGVMCNECGRERYCSITCRDEAWQRYHQILCPVKNSAAEELYQLIENFGYQKNEKGVDMLIWSGQYSPIILAKIWAMIIAEAKRLMREAKENQPTTEHWAKAKAPMRKFISYGTSAAVKKFPEIFEMMKKIFSDCGDDVSYPISPGEFEARYFQATCNLQAFSPAVTPKNNFMKNISEVEDLRALQILKYLEGKSANVYFAGMFPLHACLNHSCDNNVVVMDGYIDDKPGVHIRVVRDIETGEELCSSYIDPDMPRNLRRAWLYKSFNFWCFCRRCKFEGDDNTKCTNCNKAVMEGKTFPGCGKCKRAWYCSTKCQKDAWVKGHKAICHSAKTEKK